MKVTPSGAWTFLPLSRAAKGFQRPPGTSVDPQRPPELSGVVVVVAFLSQGSILHASKVYSNLGLTFYSHFAEIKHTYTHHVCQDNWWVVLVFRATCSGETNMTRGDFSISMEGTQVLQRPLDSQRQRWILLEGPVQPLRLRVRR